MRAAIYARISADHADTGLGVERQLEDCQELAERLGCEVVETFTDNDISAYSGKRRPAYERMLEAMEDGEVDLVLAAHTDRLHRSITELETFITICERRSIGIQTVRAGTMDLSTSAGRTAARLAAVIARGEIETARERMVRAHQQAAVKGKWRARRRVFGWVKGGSAVVPEEAEAIRNAAKDLLAGVSLRAIARRWNEAGLAPTGGAKNGFDASAVRDILKNPRTAGLQEYRGEIVGKGEWPAIITEADHWSIVALLSDPARARSASYERRHMGSGVYLCGVCGSPLEIYRENTVRLAYRCQRVRHLSRQAEALDAYVTELVIARLSQPDAALLLEREGGDVDVRELQRERDALQERLDDLAALFATGTLTRSQLERGTESLREQADKLERRIASVRTSSPLSDLLLAGDDLRAVWAAKPADVRAAVIRELMVVTVLPSPKGRRRFLPEYIDVAWLA
ncbi:recombinase family protein [Rhodococcus sp. CSLK01-03]|uniref:Recombinase family protein n=1 Tax=Rhodococcus indonesiensis TaxID=3055869 RepID=A0ABT7RLU5_9NOCA|nr:recombinase family protein [Rhodococcus indonesiensis]MDM7488614.1 recombinase family protein [Rhodococcus indonesiensis]